ncbi:hypothetical protein KCU99_g3610, partial [Aureobasidium melanogenum]
MAPKHSLDAAMGSSPTTKRARSTATTTSIVKPTYRANFDRLCALHNWTPSEAVRTKLATLLQLSGNRLEASELLPLAFVQHYPFIWVKDFLLLGYNDADESVWYKAFPTGRGMARGRYYNSAQVNILGKHTVTKFWQSWVDVFDIEQRGLDRSHEYFTGVYLILKKFPNLRYKSGKSKGDARDPHNAIRATVIAEYPFNEDHPFMQEKPSETRNVESNEAQEALDAETDNVGEEQSDASVIKQEQTDLHDQDHAFLARQLLTQLTSRANLREFDSVSSSHSQRHTANDRQGPHVNADGSASPLCRLSMQFDSRAHSRSLVSDYPSRSQEYLTDDRAGPHENEDSLTSLPGFLSEQSTSRPNSREPMPLFSPHSPEHTMDKQAGLGADDTSVTSFPSRLSKQTVFRAYSRESAPPSSSQFDKNTADKQAGSIAKQADPLFLPHQPSRKSTSRASAREIYSKSPSHATKPTSNIQIGPHIEDDMAASIFQEPKTPTSRGPLRTRKTITSPYFARIKLQSSQPKVLELLRRDSTVPQPSQTFREYTVRVPVEKPGWSNTNFKFAVVVSTSTSPEAPMTGSVEE